METTRARATRRALRLEYATLAWNGTEAVVALVAGSVAGSIALVSFGLDSLVECFAAVVVVWELRGRGPSREERAMRLIAAGFFALAAWVGFQAVADLVSRDEPAESVPGIVLASLSLLLMPVLARAKRRTGEANHLHALVADASQTALCAALSAVLLGGLVLNALVGWWWADPVAALAIAGLSAREGVKTWRGEGCCQPGPPH